MTSGNATELLNYPLSATCKQCKRALDVVVVRVEVLSRDAMNRLSQNRSLTKRI